jgi:hypothetical protein
MLRLIGKEAHSEFRLVRLLARLQIHAPTLSKLESHEEFFIDAPSLTPIEQEPGGSPAAWPAAFSLAGRARELEPRRRPRDHRA